MYSAENYNPKKESELIKFLSDSVMENRKVAIVGGHFMLFYDANSDRLVPLIMQDLYIERQKSLLKCLQELS
ncbi:MAG: hypothetical protein IPM91_02395 [Bacteroidetes bacterium]|nr:hypothetical protein [Bacteroidota bacterium]